MDIADSGQAILRGNGQVAPRQFNWVVGMILFVLALALSFTGFHNSRP